MLTETEKAYAAGIIDGEGCIGAYNTRPKLDKRGSYYQVTVRVGQRDPRIVLWLKKHFGGAIHGQYRRVNNKTYSLLTWQVRNLQAEFVLETILPYLVLKQDQAKVALEFCEFRRMQHKTLQPWKSGKSGAKRYAPDVLEARDVYINKLKLLKKQIG